MEEVIKIMIHGVGWAIIWGMGLVALPIITMLLHGHITKFEHKDISMLVAYLTFFAYILGSAVLLILI